MSIEGNIIQIQTKRTLLLACLLWLQACASYEPIPLVPADNAAALQTRSLDAPLLRQFISNNLQQPIALWPLPQWDLDTLTLAACYYHPSLDLVRAEQAVAGAARISAAERPNPTLGFAPLYNTTTSKPSPWIANISLDTPIETKGKRGIRMQRAAQLEEAARLQVVSVAWQVRGRLRRALVTLSAVRKKQALLEDQQVLYMEKVKLLELQYREGAVSSFELTQARLDAETARLALHDAQAQSGEALVAIGAAIGISASRLDDVVISFDGLAAPPAGFTATQSRQQALTHRADLLAALAQYAASQSALQLEIARQYPDLSIGPGYEYDQSDNKWALSFAVTLPVFNQNQGAIATAQAERVAAAARFTLLQAEVMAEVDTALIRYQGAARKQQDIDTLIADLAAQQLRAREMFQAGEISMSELTSLELLLSESSLAGIDVQAQSQQAASELELALQIPLDLPLSVWLDPPRPLTSPQNGNQP